MEQSWVPKDKILNKEQLDAWLKEYKPSIGPWPRRTNAQLDAQRLPQVIAKLTEISEVSDCLVQSEVLPNLSKTMITLSKESYLKDKGSTYRYKQAYKLQLVVLEHLGQLLVDLDIGDTYIEKGLSIIWPYLSNKQPIPLQKFAVQSCKTIGQYDRKMLDAQFTKLNISLEIKINVDQIKSFVCI